MKKDLDVIEKEIEDLREQYTDAACLLVRETLRIEQEKIHLAQPHGLVELVLEVIRKQIQEKPRS